MTELTIHIHVEDHRWTGYVVEDPVVGRVSTVITAKDRPVKERRPHRVRDIPQEEISERISSGRPAEERHQQTRLKGRSFPAFSRVRAESMGSTVAICRQFLHPRNERDRQSCPDHDGDIGNVEHSGPKRPSTDSKEVHDAAAE